MHKVIRLSGRYVMNILLSIDQLANSVLLGDPDETICSRIGRIKRKWGGRVPARRPVTWLADKLLELIDKGHAIDSIEEGKGSQGLVDRPPPKEESAGLISSTWRPA